MSEANVKHPYRRKWYNINSPAQLYSLGWFFLVAFVILSSFVFGFGLYIISTNSLEVLEARGFVTSFIKTTLLFWLLLTLLSWTAYIMTLKTSGPVYRFRKVLESVTAGDYETTTVQLRKRDEFKDLAETLSNMLDSLRKRRDRNNALVQTLCKNLANLKQILSEGKIASEDERKSADASIGEMEEALLILSESNPEP